jgi:hypothetical protein
MKPKNVVRHWQSKLLVGEMKQLVRSVLLFVLLIISVETQAYTKWYKFHLSSLFEMSYRLTDNGEGIKWKITNRTKETFKFWAADISYSCEAGLRTYTHYFSKSIEPGKSIAYPGYDVPCEEEKIGEIGVVKLNYQQPGAALKFNIAQCNDGSIINFYIKDFDSKFVRAVLLNGTTVTVTPRLPEQRKRDNKKLDTPESKNVSVEEQGVSGEEESTKSNKPRILERDVFNAICGTKQNDGENVNQFIYMLKEFFQNKNKSCEKTKKGCPPMRNKKKPSATGQLG